MNRPQITAVISQLHSSQHFHMCLSTTQDDQCLQTSASLAGATHKLSNMEPVVFLS